MKFAQLFFCGIAALALPTIALAKETPTAAPTVAAAAPTAHASTLFPGALDIPVAEGSNVPTNCEFPDALRSTSTELACVVTTGAEPDDVVNIEYISWLGDNGWRHAADIIGGFTATRETENGCEQVLNVYPHNDDTHSGIWFALAREPRCAAAQHQAP